jgi:hypothetical protein
MRYRSLDLLKRLCAESSKEKSSPWLRFQILKSFHLFRIRQFRLDLEGRHTYPNQILMNDKFDPGFRLCILKMLAGEIINNAHNFFILKSPGFSRGAIQSF